LCELAYSASLLLAIYNLTRTYLVHIVTSLHLNPIKAHICISKDTRIPRSF